MFYNTVDIVISTPFDYIIDNKLIAKATFPEEYKNIKVESVCPFSKFASKFNKATIRSCDGVNDLFNKSLLVRAASECYVRSADTTFESSSPDTKFVTLDHPHYQIQVTPFKFYPKIMYPAFIETKSKIKFLEHKAYYHTKNNRVYPSGIIGGDRAFNPNVIFELEKNTEDFIEYKEPLIYITAMTDKKIKVHYELITEQQFVQKGLRFVPKSFSKHFIES